MKIGILSPFYPYRGGMAQFSGRLYEELKIDHEVQAFNFSMLYPSFLFPGKTQYITEGDSAQIIHSERALNSINPLSYYKTASQINRFKPDILIVPYWMSFLSPALGSVCRLINKKTKITGLIHNAIPHEKRFFDKPLAKYFFSACDGFIALSDPVRDDLKAIIQNKPILVSPHPIYDHYSLKTSKNEAALNLGTDSTKKTLLFFGLIREYKGLDILLKAMNLLNDQYQLIIAGECYGDFKKYQDIIDTLHNKTNIKVLEEYIPDEMVSTLFSASDVLVLPYRDATQSGVVAVAYQMETPLIATNVGALGETVRKGSTGMVVNNATPEELANSIVQYFEKEAANKAIYTKNIILEKQRLSWKSFSKSILEFYSSI